MAGKPSLYAVETTMGAELINHRDQALPSFAAQFTHPNVCEIVLVIIDPNDQKG
jgi:hypothetical protein